MANWLNRASSGLQGGLGGAATGAAIGSFIPGIGTAIGAGVGAGLGGLAGLLGGGNERSGVQQAQRLDPQQQKILQYLLQQGQQGLQNPSQGFGPIAQQARSNFSQNTVPSLAERFTSMGNNALSSPSFISQLGQSGAGLEEALAALEAQYGQQNQQSSLQMLALGLSPSFENYYQPSLGQSILSGTLQAAPSFYQSHLLNQALSKR